MASARPASASQGGATPDGFCTNPILPGGFPDPSICLVGEYYYLANSSFEYFPGVPIHRSKDLVHWEWVGYGLHRPEQVSGPVNLVDVKSQDGIQAPSLRFHDGTFYIITTCVYRPPGTEEGTCTNFILSAKDPSGPWSMPHVIDGAPGIDPDIFFDDDGKVWYVGTHPPHESPNFQGEGEIWCQELDLDAWRLVGERHYLWRGACYGGVFVEGPHMYKKDGRYYLLVAEGGTGVNHAVMIASSDKVTGPFFPNERNPILTSRNLSYNNWVHSTGHADLFQLPDGRWYMVLLGIRGEAGESLDRRSNMGRETFLVPVEWEKEPMEWSPLGPPMRHIWPVAAPTTGRVERCLSVPFEGTKPATPFYFRDDFKEAALGLEWNFRRVPQPGTYSLEARAGFLRLVGRPEAIKENTACSLLGVRQREGGVEFRASMELLNVPSRPRSRGFEAGLSLFQKDDSYLNFTVKRPPAAAAAAAAGAAAEEQWILTLVHARPDAEAETLCSIPLPNDFAGGIVLRAIADVDEGYRFVYSLADGADQQPTGNIAKFTQPQGAVAKPDAIISKGYTGAYLGLYCSTNGEAADEAVDFADFSAVEHRAAPARPA